MWLSVKGSKPAVLFSTPVLHHPPVGGPTLRIENSIKALSQISDLYIYSRVPVHGLGGASGLSFYNRYCKAVYFAPHSRNAKLPWRALNWLSRRIFKNNVFGVSQESEKVYRELLERAHSICADLIWLGYGNISYPLLRHIKEHSEYKVVLDTDSVWSRFVLRGLPFAQDDQERRRIEAVGKEKEAEERWGTELADVTTAVSEVDGEYYRNLARHPQQVHLFSNAIDPESYLKVAQPPDNFRRPCLYLAGTFGPRSPMDDAARWAIREILPLVRLQIRNIQLYIVGSGSDHTLSDIRDPGITITGRLPSTLPHLCYADVAIVPLRFESGTRFKILEAAACGIPIVSTTLGAEGIAVSHGEDILIADKPRSFAESIIRLIKDRDFALRMAKNLKTLVYERYSLKSLTQEGQRILEYLLQKRLEH